MAFHPVWSQVLGSFIFLNLVVAVIIDTFSNLSDLNPSLASREDIELFKEAWSRQTHLARPHTPSHALTRPHTPFTRPSHVIGD